MQPDIVHDYQCRPPIFRAPSMRLLSAGAIAAAVVSAAVATSQAQPAPRGAPPAPPAQAAVVPPELAGLWYDDTGQGAIELLPCGDRLCGRIAWLKEPLTKTGRPLTDGLNPDPSQRQRPICGLQVIGNLALQSNGIWDKGWIYDPKEGKSYDVELRLRAPDRLQVKGYLGVKFLSETFIWTRAPHDLQRCVVATN